MPEPPARLLTPKDGWEVKGRVGLVNFSQFPDQFRYLRRSVVDLPGGILYRSWTPEAGVQEIEVVSPPFRAPRYIGIAVTGSTRTASGKNAAFLSCSNHAQVSPIFLGSSNVAAVESLIELPGNWCQGDTRLHLIAGDRSMHVGLGAAYELSALAIWKSSFVGLLPYLALALALPILIGITAAGAARRFVPAGATLLVAIAAIGLAALLAFYGYSLLSHQWSWLLPLGGLLVLLALGLPAGGRRLREAATEIKPFALAWALGALTYFTLLSAAHNGLGHWDPNYRFWPAIWSSDNELPWLFGEAVRLHQNLANLHQNLVNLYGGGWKPTDRPPLMAGAHLLVADVFAILQLGNDGSYLKGLAFNASAIAFSTLWIPAVLFVLTASLRLERRDAVQVLILIGLLPFSIFNSTYGWPKGFGAGFGLSAVAAAFAMTRSDNRTEISQWALLFGVLSALSLLSHGSNSLFLAPLAVWLFIRVLRHNVGALVIGAGVGLAVLLTWSAYQHLVLPSFDPLIRYALVGDFGFGNPAKSVLAMLSERYATLTATQWVDIKLRMLAQPLWPLSTSVVPVALNADFGADGWGRLRAWDSVLLSAGNVAILLGTLFVLWRHFGVANRVLPSDDGNLKGLPPGAAALVLLGLATWLLLALLFMAPLILHNWPATAVFALAAAGLASLQQCIPRLFRIIAAVTAFNVVLVWWVLPLRAARNLEALPLMGCALLSAWLILRLLPDALPAKGDPLNEGSGREKSGLWSGNYPFVAPTTGERIRVPQASYIPAAISALGILVVLYSGWLAVVFGGQHILGAHSFRQTQTALTSFWACRTGFKLAYETPVGGYPWSIPFEFPIYQYLVSLISCPFGFDLERVGRLFSYAFFLACLAPAVQIMRTLFGPSWRLHFWAFTGLFVSSPLYLFWGRSFLMETAALFFSLYFIAYVIKLLRGDHRWRNAIAAGAFLLLALLQKATTVLPLLAILGLLFLLHSFSDLKASRPRSLALLQGIVAFVIPFLMGYAWVKYTDMVRLHNALGSFLTTEALKGWNFGALPARFSKELWLGVIWDRVVLTNISGLIGCATLLIGFLFLKRDRPLILLVLGVFLSYFLIFENLHFVHEYYQTANLVFLVSAVSIVISRLIEQYPGRAWLPFMVFLIVVIGNLRTFINSGYYAAEKLKYDDSNVILAVSKFVRESTDPGKPILIYGDDWSSEIPFFSERKSFAVPGWFSPYFGPIENPVRYLGQQPSAIIVCGDARRPDIERRVDRFFEPDLKTVIQTCEVYMMPTSKEKALAAPPSHRSLSVNDRAAEQAWRVPSTISTADGRTWRAFPKGAQDISN